MANHLHLQHILTGILEDNSVIVNCSVVTAVSSSAALCGTQADCTALIGYFKKITFFPLCVPVKVSVRHILMGLISSHLALHTYFSLIGTEFHELWQSQTHFFLIIPKKTLKDCLLK